MRFTHKRYKKRPIAKRDMDKKIKSSGKEGENKTAMILSQLPFGYFVLNNVLLKQEKIKVPYRFDLQQHTGRKVVEQGRVYEIIQKTTQIDHVVVSQFGIFVIETKNHSGMIFGDAYGKCWTQVLAGINKRVQFTNPVVQNTGHIRALSKATNIPESCMRGLIVFTNDNVILNNVMNYCCDLNSLLFHITKFQTPIWNVEQAMYIAQGISQLNASSKYNDAKHVKYVNQIKQYNGG